MNKKNHGAPHEEHADETWLIPYSDLLTLLLALFIVLFASAQVDQKKFEQMAQSFSAAFSGGTSVFDSSSLVKTPNEQQPPSQQSTSIMGTINELSDKYMQETALLAEIKKKLDRYIGDNGLGGVLTTQLTEEGLLIRIRDTALFPSGSADLRPESLRLGAEIAKMLLPISQKISVSGHTDNVPINTFEFPSNWELSSKRAVNFMKFLLAQEPTLKSERFSATGYGEYRPIVTNDTEEGRSTNRRVEVFVQRNYRM
ncbi:MAG TPA: flagellar motor protein MotB [Methylomusa anaerophila]|uniref:Motility protein B n=1 Tax=Methylomusa anaerophila TaxID=1930071 RepID=A0A348AMJ1_9FIRM|nr:flagellar motor protein MotB [Methylomusa anaerophila]BBB92289.1 motility protein B [Methylomusa anaerophila]HML90250.1 flagellar motor protein MotB [Methylomusa anaerophila]